MRKQFTHKLLVKVTNVTIKAIMVSLTNLAATGITVLIFKLVTNPNSFSGVGGIIN